MAAPTAQSVLNIARSQLGTVEKPANSNRTPYGAWYGWNGVAWCAEFASWCFDEADALSLVGGKHAATYLWADWFREHNQWGTTPRVGALAFYDFPDSLHRIQHVGLVETIVSAAVIDDIEGNTSSGSRGSQDNGDGVFRRRRSTVHIVGYGYPKYAVAGTKKPIIVPAAPGKVKVILLVDGVWGAKTTKALQAALGITVDGGLGPQTRKAVQKWAGLSGRDVDGVWGRVTRKAIQRKLGVAADGAIGPATIKALQRWLNAR